MNKYLSHAKRLYEMWRYPSDMRGVWYRGEVLYIQPSESLCERRLWKKKGYERKVSNLISHKLNPGDYAVDVGAHVGHHSIDMLKAVGRSGKVSAIEPHPRRRKLLRQTKRMYEQRNECANFEWLPFIAGNSERSRGLAEGGVPQVRAAGSIPTIRLDSVLKTAHKDRIDLLKVDVEGYEYQVLQGIDTDRIEAMILEYHPEKVLEHFHPAKTCKDFTLEELFGEVQTNAYMALRQQLDTFDSWKVVGGNSRRPNLREFDTPTHLLCENFR